MSLSKSSSEDNMCCKCGKIIKYRCKYNGETLGCGVIPDHPLLKCYWWMDIWMGVGGKFTLFIACDECITEEALPYFTYIPEGYADLDYHKYEEIKLDWCKTKLA